MSAPSASAQRDTIFALATGARRAAIAIIRISGPHVPAIAHGLLGRLPVPRVGTFVRVRDPQTGEILDEALALFFEARRSELGEDGLELHVHGSPAVIEAVLTVLARQDGARQAEPGEFARRAFANGRVDLAQLEGLADLVDAETQAQRRQAQRQVSGALAALVAPWRAALIEAAADVETAIDFAEDVTLGAALPDRLSRLLRPIKDRLAQEIAGAPAAERIRDGINVVIAGPPNAGKSSLLNALVQREAAIVSAIAGTTRDPVEVMLDLDGQSVVLIDTAGLRETGDPIETIGIERTRARVAAADLVLWLAEDGAEPPDFNAPLWRLGAKADLHPSPGSDDALPISATRGDNLAELAARLQTFAASLTQADQPPLLTRERHRQCFETARAALDRALSSPALPEELVAEDLRIARIALDRLLGKVDVEDILGSVFSRFCIGK